MAFDPAKKQKIYYAKIAGLYDNMFTFDPDDEHFIACSLLTGLAKHYEFQSLLDVGCGTGRAIKYLSKSLPSIRIAGVEPVKEMLHAAQRAGIAPDSLHLGDATQLPFGDGAFDCCSAFGVLHHIAKPELAVRELFRVSKHAVFISDHNIYGMGSHNTRAVKQFFRDIRAQWILRLLMTKGKGYHDTDWDGIFYPFSLIDHLDLIHSLASRVHILPTRNSSINIYKQTSHLAILALI